MDAQSFAALRPGQIVLAFINDPQGRNPKWRPAIILEQHEDDNGAIYFEVIGGTNEPIQVRFQKYTVTLGIAGQRCPRTLLDEETRFSAHWLEPIELRHARHVIGNCTDSAFQELLQKLQQFETDFPAEPS